jgi:hypothetical protein
MIHFWNSRGLARDQGHPKSREEKLKKLIQFHCQHQQYLNQNPNDLQLKFKGSNKQGYGGNKVQPQCFACHNKVGKTWSQWGGHGKVGKT